MSALSRYGEGLAGDPAMLDFVDWLTIRTTNGLVPWDVKPNLISAKLLGPLLAEFVIAARGEGLAWTLFTIRDEDQKEVFRACPQKIAGKESEHARVTECLFAAVRKRLGAR